MKNYTKPELNTLELVSVDAIATNPWGSFAEDLEELGGSITSYDYGSGVQLGQ